MFEYRASLLRVVDGDTIEAMVDLGFMTYQRHMLRLAGIDAPEVPEREEGLDVKVALAGKLAEYGGELVVETDKDRGKFGRYIATIHIGEGSTRTNINAWLVEQGYAEPYE